MVEWSATTDAVCGFGECETVELAVDGWQLGGDPPALGSRVDAAVVGTARAVQLPPGDAALVGEDRRPLPEGSLPAEPREVAVDAAIETRVAFTGAATVEPSPTGPWLRFPERTPLKVGFREATTPRETVTIPATPAGVAAAVTAAAGTHRTDRPARSHPGYRPRTPRVTFSEGATPDGSADAVRPTLTVPVDTVSVLVAAPLAYYLGAVLRTGNGAPVLRTDGFEYAFDPEREFADEVGELLRGLCGLDVRLRDVPGETGPLNRTLDLESGTRLREADPVDRLRHVVDADTAYRETWPLATYVDDDVANARYLPYVLDNLSLVHPAEASSLDPRALLKRSLEEFFRGETANVDTVDPSLADSRYHAWCGDGAPIDAFTLLGTGQAAGESGFADESGFDVEVVCNDPEMRSEESVAAVYRKRLDGPDVDVRVHDRLATTDLASVFERRSDLVHFIGHCEVDGLVCPDGHLAAADLERCGAAAFFLNACGSYHEGYDLVRRGATVGGVTLTTVLDEQAMRVGTTFAELLASGFAVARALSLARSEILAGRDYVVVGDGCHRLRPPRGDPGVFRLERAADGFRVAFDATSPDAAGRRCRDPLAGGESVRGAPPAATLDAAAVRALFERYSAPVRFEGELRWTDGVLAALQDL